MSPGRSASLLKSGLLLVVVSVGAAGCRDHVSPFLSIVGGDAGVVDAQRRDAAPLDLHFGGTGGTTGRDGGTGGTLNRDGGFGASDGSIGQCVEGSADLQTDPANCGHCFHQCIAPNGTPSCVAGSCQIKCDPGFYDADGDPSNGCECTQTSGGVEICDGLDNDCNGIVDDGFDFMTDVTNCGACNHQCAFPFAMASCNIGVCTQWMCLPDF
jgi:hypothetical protein